MRQNGNAPILCPRFKKVEDFLPAVCW